MHNKISPIKIGMLIELLKARLRIGVIPIAKPVPIRAHAISSPIANAISLPLNHLTMIFDTVIPAISMPTPKSA